jgi:hypothetical protein
MIAMARIKIDGTYVSQIAYSIFQRMIWGPAQYVGLTSEEADTVIQHVVQRELGSAWLRPRCSRNDRLNGFDDARRKIRTSAAREIRRLPSQSLNPNPNAQHYDEMANRFIAYDTFSTVRGRSKKKKQPIFIFISGGSASGKDTLASLLQAFLNIDVVYSTDRFREQIHMQREALGVRDARFPSSYLLSRNHPLWDGRDSVEQIPDEDLRTALYDQLEEQALTICRNIPRYVNEGKDGSHPFILFYGVHILPNKERHARYGNDGQWKPSTYEGAPNCLSVLLSPPDDDLAVIQELRCRGQKIPSHLREIRTLKSALWDRAAGRIARIEATLRCDVMYQFSGLLTPVLENAR